MSDVPSLADRAGTCVFFCFVMSANLTACIACHCLAFLHHCGALGRVGGGASRLRREGMAILVTRTCWAAALLLARPWVRQRSAASTSGSNADPWDAVRRDLRDSLRRGEAKAKRRQQEERRQQNGGEGGEKVTAGSQEESEEEDEAVHPIMLLSNHVSFLDTLMTTVATPSDVL